MAGIFEITIGRDFDLADHQALTTDNIPLASFIDNVYMTYGQISALGSMIDSLGFKLAGRVYSADGTADYVFINTVSVVGVAAGANTGGYWFKAPDDSVAQPFLAWGGNYGDVIEGNDGWDYLEGFGGNDVLRGGDGDDRLAGGAGYDTISGGSGKDYFSGSIGMLDGDVITDIEVGESLYFEDLLTRVPQVRLFGDQLVIDYDGNGVAEAVIRLDHAVGGVRIESYRISDTYLQSAVFYEDLAVSAMTAVPIGSRHTTAAQYTITFNAAVKNLQANDFVVTGGVTGSVHTPVSTDGGFNWTVLVDNLAGEGQARLDLRDIGTSVTGLLGGSVKGYTAGPSVSVDNNPIQLTLSSQAANENLAAGSSIAALSATGPGQAFTYALVDDHNGTFRLSGNQLQVVKPLDYEAISSHPIKVAVMDSFGNVAVKDVTIDVLDVANERVTGTLGSEWLRGGVGNDRLSGEAGDDRLFGGTGKDILTGGRGKDAFVFDTKAAKSNVDTIKDFVVRDDTFWIDSSVFIELGKDGSLKASAFWIGSRAHDKTDRIIYDEKKGVLYYDADGIGGSSQVQIASLSKNLKMSHKDIFVI